jgi:Na+-translocating ferredoxin:NAD+ oxidoreductase subunit C
MIFQKTHGIQIDGRKDMSKKTPLEEYFNPEYVYIHLLKNIGPLKSTVNVGDKVKVGQIVAIREGFGEMNVHATISGEVTAIKKAWHPSGKMVDAIEIKNDFKNDPDPSIHPNKAIDALTKEELIDMMKEAGLTGLGGAGFPTYIKYITKLPIDTVIINAVECEPYLTCDYTFITTYPEKLLKGLKYFMKAASANRGVIAYKAYNKGIKNALEKYLKHYKNISLFELQDVYPAGWEKYIIERITGKTYSGLPSEVGVIVNNSSTAIAFSDIVEHNIPLISRPITITGEGIKEPKNFYVPIGTKVSDLVEKCGGYTSYIEPKEANYIAGGPMTGNAIFIDDLIVTDTLGGIIVKPVVDKLHPECLGCGKCADICPAYLTPTEIKKALDYKDLDLIQALNANSCVQCGLCSYVCPSHVEITDAVVKAKGLLRKGAK